MARGQAVPPAAIVNASVGPHCGTPSMGTLLLELSCIVRPITPAHVPHALPLRTAEYPPAEMPRAPGGASTTGAGVPANDDRRAQVSGLDDPLALCCSRLARHSGQEKASAVPLRGGSFSAFPADRR
eukprot:scaffold3161_cov118-Isochrysis_galbana.AAC.3